MARLTTLANLLLQLKAQLGVVTGTTANDGLYAQLLSDKQKWLAGEYDWPFLQDRFDCVIPPGTRYNSFPTLDNEGVTSAMNLERPYTVEVFWNNVWSELQYDISSEEFNYLNSDQAGVIQDPIQRWRWSEEGQFEIWPVNATSQVVRFTGQRALDNLGAPTDTADLDDMLIVLSVAAEILQRNKQPDAETKGKLAMERLRAVRANYPTRHCGLVFGGGTQDELTQRKRLVPIAVAGR